MKRKPLSRQADASRLVHRVLITAAAVITFLGLSRDVHAFNEPVDSAGPLTVRIEGPKQVSEVETPLTVTVQLENRSESAVAGTCAVVGDRSLARRAAGCSGVHRSGKGVGACRVSRGGGPGHLQRALSDPRLRRVHGRWPHVGRPPDLDSRNAARGSAAARARVPLAADRVGYRGRDWRWAGCRFSAWWSSLSTPHRR